MDKISSYDNEGLSPVFIIVYCDIDDFTQLTKDYKNMFQILVMLVLLIKRNVLKR